MNVMLCGASDMKVISGQFIDTVKRFGFSPLCFIDGTIHYNNYTSWEENSELSVQNADIVVYVILEKHGVLTWNTEFTTAKNLGKPFIIFCLEETYNFYVSLSRNPDIHIEEGSVVGKVINLLSQIDSEQRTIIPFAYNTFDELLHRQILLLLRQSIKSLQKENQKKVIINLVKANSVEVFKENITTDYDVLLLKEILFDIFENKELRKRSIDYFTHYKILTDTEIIDLVNDHEQGVRRKAVVELKNLVSLRTNIGLLFNAVIEACKTQDDIGLVNRAIPALFETDLKEAVKYLIELFPQKNSTTSERIMYWYHQNRQQVDNAIRQDNVFKKDLLELVLRCEEYNQGIGEWKEIAHNLIKRLQE